MSPPVLLPPPTGERVVNYVTCVSRDGLTAQLPFGRPHTMLPRKIVRTMRSPLLAPSERDDRPAPEPGSPDFHHRAREYVFAHVEVTEGTGVATAIYHESM